jgi:steroid delta-isomerase-like uncharacterized protein
MRRPGFVTFLCGLVVATGLLVPGFAASGSAQSGDDSGTPAACQATTEEENIAIARVWHEEVINNRNPEALADILAPEVVHHAAGGYPETMTEQETTAMMSEFVSSFPDLQITFDLFIVQDDLVVERYTATGTQDGPLQDLPASGRTATWTGINIFRIECGRIVEIWSEVDALSRNSQLTGDTTATPAP